MKYLHTMVRVSDLDRSLDFYVNETNKHADYVLPSTTWLESRTLPLAPSWPVHV